MNSISELQATKPVQDVQVSIITVNFNGAATLKRLLDGVGILLDENPQMEHVIIDGVSTDGSIDILLKYASQFRNVLFVSERDSGIYDAMNKGVRRSSGKYFIHLNSDDEPVSFYRWVEILKTLDSHSPLVYTTPVPIVKDGRAVRILPARPFMQLHRRFGYHFPHQGTFFKRELLLDAGGYSMKIGYIADKIFCYQLLDRVDDSRIVFDPITIALQHAGGVSSESNWTPIRTLGLAFASAKLIRYRNPYLRALINPIFKMFSVLLFRVRGSRSPMVYR